MDKSIQVSFPVLRDVAACSGPMVLVRDNATGAELFLGTGADAATSAYAPAEIRYISIMGNGSANCLVFYISHKDAMQCRQK